MALYLIQERWGRVCLHLVAALRAGHWRWHLAGMGREMEGMWPQTHQTLDTANAWPEPGNNGKGQPA